MLFSRFSPPVPKFFIKPQPPKEEGAWSKRSVSAGSSCRDGGVEEPAKALGAAGDPAQEPADADDSLEAKVDFLVHLPLALPPPACHQKAMLVPIPLFAALLSCALRAGWAAGPVAGHGASGEGEIR